MYVEKVYVLVLSLTFSDVVLLTSAVLTVRG